MLQLRKQRGALAQVAGAHSALARVGGWLQQLQLPQHQHQLEHQHQQQQQQQQQEQPLALLPPQRATLAQLGARKTALDALGQRASDTAQLLAACAHAHAAPTPAQQGALQAGAECAAAACARIAGARARVAGALADTHVPLQQQGQGQQQQQQQQRQRQQQQSAPGGAHSLRWASGAAWAALAGSREVLEEVAASVGAAATAAAAAAAPPSAGGAWVAEEAPGLPGMGKLAAQLRAAAEQAAAWERAHAAGGAQQRAPSLHPQPAGALPSPAGTAVKAAGAAAAAGAGAGVGPSGRSSSGSDGSPEVAQQSAALAAEVEGAVASVLVWAQGLDAAARAHSTLLPPARAPPPHAGADGVAAAEAVAAAAAAAGSAAAGAAAEGPQGLLRWMERLEAATQVGLVVQGRM